MPGLLADAKNKHDGDVVSILVPTLQRRRLSPEWEAKDTQQLVAGRGFKPQSLMVVSLFPHCRSLKILATQPGILGVTCQPSLLHGPEL